MDKIDKKILELLQLNSQISNQELADKVALSPSPCSRRVKLLEDEGYINKYIALLNPQKLGLEMTILLFVGLNSHDPKKMRHFETAVSVMPEVMECLMIAGEKADYVLKILVPNLDSYQSLLLNKITRIEVVSNVRSSFVLKSIVDRTALPLNHL